MRTLVLLSLLTIISCTSQTSKKELELLQRENELLKKEKELAEKEGNKPTESANKNEFNKANAKSVTPEQNVSTKVETYNGNVQDSPIYEHDKSNLAQKLRMLLIGHEFRKGKLSWKFVSEAEITELNVTNHHKNSDGTEYAQITVLLTDIYGKGGRFYGKLLLTYTDNILTEIQPIEYYEI